MAFLKIASLSGRTHWGNDYNVLRKGERICPGSFTSEKETVTIKSA